MSKTRTVTFTFEHDHEVTEFAYMLARASTQAHDLMKVVALVPSAFDSMRNVINLIEGWSADFHRQKDK